MRTAFSNALVAAAKADSRILLLTGDHGYALFDDFRSACPDQYINAGVAEQNMVGVAAGLAKGGFHPFVYGLSAFVPIRVLEQIKMDVCYHELPVIFIGDGAGVVYSTLGSSHQSTEDIAAIRSLPNISIYSPADAWEMAACMKLAISSSSPVYLRMGKADLGTIHDSVPSFQNGGLINVKQGRSQLAFVATGSMVFAARAVANLWPDVAVWSAPSIKPINADAITEIARQHELIVTFEEHSVTGGLGSIVAEIVSERFPRRVLRIGIQERFSQFCGTYEYLMREHKLDVESVVKKIRDYLLSQGMSDDFGVRATTSR
ncbi:MAG: transketolase [Spirochaetia bacterium]|nr:transketolase [Spirochaetia bacterium]